jgi:hypothetical protein
MGEIRVYTGVSHSSFATWSRITTRCQAFSVYHKSHGDAARAQWIIGETTVPRRKFRPEKTMWSVGAEWFIIVKILLLAVAFYVPIEMGWHDMA